MPDYRLITENVLRRIQAPASGSSFVRDASLPGFGVRVRPNGVVSFIVERRRTGGSKKPQRITLGRWTETPGRDDGTALLTVKEARAKALSVLAELGDPHAADPDPEPVRRPTRYTVEDVMDLYLADRGRRLKRRTIEDYQTLLGTVLAPFRDVPITEITRADVKARHLEYADRSEARANNGMRVLRALLNYAAAELEGPDGRPMLDGNPVARLSAGRGFWHRVPRRQTVLKPHELPAWFAAVDGLRAERITGQAAVARDYFHTLIRTGLRKSEAAGLQAQDVDLRDRSFTVRDTKNHDDHVLPIPAALVDVFERRLETASPWVFPNAAGDGPLAKVDRWQKKVTDVSGVRFALHDLRRTFTTVGESLDISVITLKRLLNHRTGTYDVTAGYAVLSVDRLREAIDRIGARLDELAELEAAA